MSALRIPHQDTLTPAVIAAHGQATDARLRDLMTALVQHLHAFAREARLSGPELGGGLAFLAEAAAHPGELARLADALGLSALVAALPAPLGGPGTEPMQALGRWPAHGRLPCWVQGQVRDSAGRPLAGARIEATGPVPAGTLSDAQGGYGLRSALAAGAPDAAPAHPDARSGAWPLPARPRVSGPVDGPADGPTDGPVDGLLAVLGRPAQRPPHLPLRVQAAGCAALATELHTAAAGPAAPGAGARRVLPDAAFGARAALLATVQPQPAGTMPDGSPCGEPWLLLGFDLVLQRLPDTG